MKLYVLSTLSFGIDFINIIKEHMDISGVIGLTEKKTDDGISGYMHLADYCKKIGIHFIEVDSYGLTKSANKRKLLALNIDILVVAGWQRLIPKWLINHCKVAAIGAHGSSYGINLGRGRSPQNWALLMGEKEFDISIYKIDEGIDSGQVIDSCKFEINETDDIKTSYDKAIWLVAHMVIQCIENNTLASTILRQQEEKPRYLPQRIPKDGEIDWTRSAKEIYDFVRALTKPYPGAFTILGQSKIKIWKGRYLRLERFQEFAKPGEIALVLANQDLLVGTGLGYFLIEEYEAEQELDSLKAGDQFSSADFSNQMQQIVQRHQEKYPDLPVAEQIMRLINN